MIKVYQLQLPQNTFEVTLKYKGMGVRVAFEDGNTYNGTPAKCYTNDPFKQRAIEASTMFQNKEIVLERTVEEPGDKKPAAPKPAKPTPTPTPAPQNPTPAPQTPTPAPQNPETEGNVGTGEQGEQGQNPGAENGEGADKGESITFNSLAEAIVYVASHFNESVRTENEARKALKEHGINPTIKRG